MMYLVLLALLAMNVSAEILDAFKNIHKRLENSSTTALDGSQKFMASMIEEINEEVENEGKKDNIGLIDTLATIQSQTAEIVQMLDQHINHLRDSIIKRDKQTGKLLNLGETEKNLQYFMGQGKDQEADGGRGQGEARKVKDALNKYYQDINSLYNSQVKSDSAKQDLELLPDAIAGQDGNEKTWEQYNFEGPAIANVATLEAMKLDLYEREKDLLNLLNNRLGVATFKADEVIALEAPVSTIVPAGLQYETRLFAVMTSSQMKPEFRSGSGSIEKDESGNFATLKIGASGGVIPKNKNEGVQSYSATIQVPKATGGFEDLKVEGKFTVRRPEIVVTSAAIQILYQACGNDVNIDVPALGDLYNPKVTSGQATIIPSKASKKKFRIVPRGSKAVVGVSSVTNGKTLKIGDLSYKVIRPPKPTIEMAVNNKSYNGSAMVPKTSRIAVRLVPDSDFKSALPEDAKYGITSIDVLAQLSLGPPTKVNSVRGAKDAVNKPVSVALGTKVRQSARPGTKVYVRLNEVFRVNFQGKRVTDDRFREIERTLSLVVK
ncbi:MAG: hypothetical protein AAF587_18080 [Bacteroidota bacterium]